jgi:hypothetical protein
VAWKGFSSARETRVRPRTRARDWATVSAVTYELSRGLHLEANWRAERLGPIFISPLQRGHRQVEPLAAIVEQVSVGFGVAARSSRASAGSVARRVLVRNPNCRMRTKPPRKNMLTAAPMPIKSACGP